MSDIREATLEAITALLDGDQLLMRLFDEGREQHSTSPSESAHRKISGSPTPWADQYTLLALTVHGDARRFHNRLTWNLWGSYRDRGNTHAAVRAYLIALPDLCAAAGLHADQNVRDLAHEISHEMRRHARRCREALDEARDDEQRPSRAPGNLSCPYCHQRLLLPAGWQHQPKPSVYCGNPECRTSTGERLTWPATAWLAALSA